jgi:ABC-type transport system involved in cytochrome bd biosynthesis fused ATPase/permease subunit
MTVQASTGMNASNSRSGSNSAVMLFIDEGTANLDVDLERRINEMLSKLPASTLRPVPKHDRSDSG